MNKTTMILEKERIEWKQSTKRIGVKGIKNRMMNLVIEIIF